MTRPSVTAATFLAASLLLAGCSDGIRQHIRDRDFRQRAAAAPGSAAAPSPIANVADMPGWTTDIEGATAFSAENGQRTIVFLQNDVSPSNRVFKTVLNSQEVSAVSNVQRVTFSVNSSPELASRFPVAAPAILVLDPNGTIIVQQQNKANKSQLLSAIR